MNCKIPFTKDIDFERKVYEITSISLEHEINITDNTLKGNFIVSGDFKSHEVSVNKEAFSYILPFEIDLREDIDKETIEFLIEDFTYQIVNDSILRVNIDFSVIASLTAKHEEDSIFHDASEIIKELDKVNNDTLELPLKEEREVIEMEEDEMIEEVKKEETEEKLSETTIIEAVNETEEEYATYHIHMVSDGETVETICTMYNSNINLLSEYNDLNNINPKDKLIIPDKTE